MKRAILIFLLAVIGISQTTFKQVRTEKAKNVVIFHAKLIAPYQIAPGKKAPLVFISSHRALFIRVKNIDTGKYIQKGTWIMAPPNKVYSVIMPVGINGIEWSVWTPFGTLYATTIQDWYGTRLPILEHESKLKRFK